MNKKIILIIVSVVGLLLLIPVLFFFYPYCKKIYLENTSANEEEKVKALIVSSINFPEKSLEDTVLYRDAFFICGNTLFLEEPITFALTELVKEIKEEKGIYIFDEDKYFHSLDSLKNRQPFYNEEVSRLDSLKHKDYLRLSAHAFKISNNEIHLQYSFYSFSEKRENNMFGYHFFYRNGQWIVEKQKD